MFMLKDFRLTLPFIFWSLTLLFAFEITFGMSIRSQFGEVLALVAPFKQLIAFTLPFLFCFINNIKAKRDIENSALIPVTSAGACILVFSLLAIVIYFDVPPFNTLTQQYVWQEFLGDFLPYSILAPIAGCLLGRMIFRREELKKQFLRFKW